MENIQKWRSFWDRVYLLSNMPLTEINYWFITDTVDTGHDPGALWVTQPVEETPVEKASAQQDWRCLHKRLPMFPLQPATILALLRSTEAQA